MLLDSVDVNHLGVLGLVGMVGTVVDVEVLEKLTSETVFGEHTLDNAEVEGVHARLEVLVEGFLHQHFRGLHALPAGVTGVVVVNLLCHLVAGQNDFVGVDDDHIVAASHVGGVAGLVFAAEDLGHLRAESSEDLVGSVDDDPFLLDALGIGGKGLVT